MKKIAVKTAAAALAGVMAVSMFAGCGEKKIDGAAVAATVNGTDIELGTLSLAVRYQQAQTEAMYLAYMGSAASIWDGKDEETGKTYGEQVVADVLLSLEQNEILRQKAAEYEVELTEEDQTAIAEAAAEFMEVNTEETLAELAVTEEQVKTYLELLTYRVRMEEALHEEVKIEVSDEEAQQSSFTYVTIPVEGEDLTEEAIAENKEQAQEILDKMKEDPEADMDAIAKETNEELMALSGTFSANVMVKKDAEEEEESYSSESYPEEVLEVLRGLGDGEVAEEVIEAEGELYIARLDLKNDEEATESKKESLKSEKQNAYYTETVDAWVEEAEITENDKVIETLVVKDNHDFTIQMPEEEVTEEVTEEVLDEETVNLDEMDAEELEEIGMEEIEAENAEEVMDEGSEEELEEIEEPVEEDAGEVEEISEETEE